MWRGVIARLFCQNLDFIFKTLSTHFMYFSDLEISFLWEMKDRFRSYVVAKTE